MGKKKGLKILNVNVTSIKEIDNGCYEIASNQFLKCRRVHRLYCEDCNAEMKKSELVRLTYPAQYQYVCPTCKKEKVISMLYPFVEEVWVGENGEEGNGEINE